MTKWKLVPVEPMENIALNEWLDKTEWVQKEINTFPVSSLGMHRADVMRIEIERLREMLAAPPAPIVPEGWRLVPYTPTVLMLERAAYAVNNRPQPSKYEPSATPAIIFWTAMLNYAPEAPQDAEPPADAARLDWLDERNAPHGLGWEIIQMPAGNVHIHTLTGDKAKFGSIREAIDAAIERQGGES